MKFNELFTADNGIFTQVFKPDFPELYETCFGEVESVTLDRFTWMEYGSRGLLDIVSESTYKYLIGCVISLNAEKWAKVSNLLKKEYDCLNPEVKTITTTKTTTTATSEANENVNAQKTFNDEQFNDGERTQTNGTGSRQDDESMQSTESGLGYFKSNSDVIKKEKELRQDDYKRSIIAELIAEITLTIYI